MAYTTEQIVANLKAWRQAKGLSQRALAELIDVPQSHISKIESGGVDLRLSSLVEIARALDLDVVLVPQKNVAAVRSIVQSVPTNSLQASTTSGHIELQRLRTVLVKLMRQYPQLKEIAQLLRQVNELMHFRIPESFTEKLAETRRALRNFSNTKKHVITLKAVLAETQVMRNELAHDAHAAGSNSAAKPAYSLEADDNG